MDALIEHGVEECGVAVDVLSPCLVVVRHVDVGEEHGEHRVRRLDDVGDALGFQARSDGRAQSVRGTTDVRVHVEFGRQLERGQTGSGGHRIARERSCLVDGAGRGEVGHDLGATAEGRCREAAAHDLAEGEQVGRAIWVAESLGLVAVPAGSGDTEAGHHFVADHQRTVGLGQPSDGVRETVAGRHDAHIAGAGLGDDAGDVLTVFGEYGFETGGVVVVDDDRVLCLGSGDSGVSGRENVASPEPAWASSEST